MAIQRDRPYAATNFQVDYGSGDASAMEAGFAEVSIPEARVRVIRYRSGNDKLGSVRKLPTGVTEYANVVLKRGFAGTLDLYEWWDQARNGDASVRRTVTVSLLSEDRSDVVVQWKLIEAWPVSWRISDLDAQDGEVAMEIVELTYERLTVE